MTVEQDVFSLYVPMDDALGMQIRDSYQYGFEEELGFFFFQSMLWFRKQIFV
jgi:hypothetical protein